MLTLDTAYRRGGFSLQARLSFDHAVTGLCGPSGSGKSTLLGIIAGLIRPQLGSIRFGDEILFDAGRRIYVPAHRRHFGLVFQDGQLFPHLSVRSNLLYGHRHLQVSQRKFGLDAVVEMLELGNLLERRPRQLSGGEKQRVALGRAILFSPRMLLLDEPLASLDDSLKQQILPFMRRIRDEIGIPMIYVSHSREEISYLTRHCQFIEDGRLVARTDAAV